jgi:glycosyltransferase involved in cell wall biosynthesis
MTSRRVAFFTDSYHEVNGVALTSREFACFVKDAGYPFFSVHAGPATEHWAEGVFETFEIAHSSFVLGLERDLAFDLFVFPSQTDTFGNVVLEAMASGVPAIVSAHGGPRSFGEGEADWICRG